MLAKLKLGNESGKGVGIYLAAGPWLGVGLSGKYKSVVSSNGANIFETERTYSFDDEDDTKRLNYGMIGAAGASLGRLALDLRYNYGFNNLPDADANNTNDNKPVLQTRSIALTLGYAL